MTEQEKQTAFAAAMELINVRGASVRAAARAVGVTNVTLLRWRKDWTIDWNSVDRKKARELVESSGITKPSKQSGENTAAALKREAMEEVSHYVDHPKVPASVQSVHEFFEKNWDQPTSWWLQRENQSIREWVQEIER